MKRKSLGILFAILAIFVVLISCTLPIYVVTSPEEKQETQEVIVVTATAAPATETPAPTSTPTLEVTPTVAVYLDGPWTIWMGTSKQKLTIDFLQEDYTLTANVVTSKGHSTLFEGTVSSDGSTVNGTWKSTNGTSGNFAMYLTAPYGIFMGNMGGGVPFCGNRESTSMPSPCLQ